MQDLLQLKEEYSQQGLLISFNGPFNHSILEEIGNATKSYLEEKDLERGIITDVFAVYIEQTQNTRNYIVRRNLESFGQDSAIILINQVEGHYRVSCGNSMLRSDVADLTRRLEEVNGLDKDGLKRRYKEELRKQRPADAQGAGVGIIEMARRASGKLEFRFQALDDVFVFFTLCVTV